MLFNMVKIAPQILTKRHDFVAASKSRHKGVASSLIVQLRLRGDDAPPRYGITASKKIGNAVTRNRAKRRLRALVRGYLFGTANVGAGIDYVLIARHNTVSVDWAHLVADIDKALKRAAVESVKSRP